MRDFVYLNDQNDVFIWSLNKSNCFMGNILDKMLVAAIYKGREDHLE